MYFLVGQMKDLVRQNKVAMDNTSDGSGDEPEPERRKRARVEKSFENEQRTYTEPVSSTIYPMWKETIKSEVNSILQNHTWEPVDLPLDCEPLGSKWIFKRKMKHDDNKFKTDL
ncbi:unnamed protein product [Cuscuta epithymum]|uniref:Reverse transcriptase Ty1/copia-type domain-containing protein n=1 Tax=Cuscuta epithymum TaxID=186058 RepID=A0AAV0C567_9ASTE|nr:unnamed protein product [Cuscuta epithymum]